MAMLVQVSLNGFAGAAPHGKLGYLRIHRGGPCRRDLFPSERIYLRGRAVIFTAVALNCALLSNVSNYDSRLTK
jgi:hypothetical protein